MFIQKSDKATHQDSSWITARLQFTFSRSQENKQLQTVGSATYQADNKRNLQSVKAFLESLVELTLAWSVSRRIENKLHMVEAFGGWNLCPSGRPRQKKWTIWPQTFLKNRSGEESEQTSLALSCFRWSYSIAGLWVSFSFPRLMSCASTRLNLNTCSGF